MVSYASDLGFNTIRYIASESCHTPESKDLSQLHLNLLMVNLDVIQPCVFHPWGSIPSFTGEKRVKTSRYATHTYFDDSQAVTALAPGHFRRGF